MYSVDRIIFFVYSGTDNKGIIVIIIRYYLIIIIIIYTHTIGQV